MIQLLERRRGLAMHASDRKTITLILPIQFGHLKQVDYHAVHNSNQAQALLTHLNGKDWVLWQPDGYYASSAFGDNLIGWHVNRGKDEEPDFYRAVQFERSFFRPDIVKNVISTQLQKTGPELLDTKSATNSVESIQNPEQHIPAEKIQYSTN